MRLIFPRPRFAIAVLLCAFGCSSPAQEPATKTGEADPTSGPAQAPTSTSVVEKPARPLSLAVPTAPPSDDNGEDLSKVDGDVLLGLASKRASENDFRGAAKYQFWAVKSGESGQYNLACWLALSGDIEAAFYWLQEAALDDGVDASWAGQDSDLDSLRKDPRWKQIAPYLKKCNAYWASGDHRKTVLILPAGYQKGSPIGALIGMHGMGHNPDGFVDRDSYQEFADELNMAIVGVSGTVANGRRSFVWSEDPPTDARRVRRALEEVSDRLTVKPGHLIAFGFSQGAQMGFEVAFQDPDEYRGAIVMSPGTNSRFFRLSKLTPSPKNKTQGYVCLCGAGEAPGNVAFTKGNAQFAQTAGARVELKLYEGMDRHAFPPDFRRSFTRWVRFIDGSGSEAKLE